MMRAMHEQLAGSEFVSIVGAGHLSNLEQPDTFNTVLRGFLENHGA
jgi:pimeloyl-ACP methyl ester carboxylesterase